MAWFSLPKYYENAKSYNIINNTIINSASILAKAVFGIAPLLIGFAFFALCIFLQSPRFGNLTFSFHTLNALQYTEGVYDIFFNIFQTDWLMSQAFVYIFLFLVIIIIQNVFLIIIGDGYVKSKYFHKNNWVKVGDKCLFSGEEGEDPLKCFKVHDPQAEKSTQALVKMLKADKEFLLTEYYATKGIKYNPHIFDEEQRVKSPEELTRNFERQIDEIVKEYESSIKEIDNNLTLTEIEEKEKMKDMLYNQAEIAVKALEYKLDKISKHLE